MRLVPGPVFKNVEAGFAIASWWGNAGDTFEWPVEKPVKRADFASSSIIARGAFGYPKGYGFVRANAGQLVNEVMPDWDRPGIYVWHALEDDSLELCATRIDEKGEQCRERFYWAAVDTGNFILDKGTVLIAATGSWFYKGVEIKAPHIFYAATEAMEIIARGRGMHIAR